jgi:hypothetical protein
MEVAMGGEKEKKSFKKRHPMSMVFKIGTQCKNIEVNFKLFHLASLQFLWRFQISKFQANNQ